MLRVLIVGASRGLGASLAKQYAAKDGTTVYGTARSDSSPEGFPESIKWLSGVDLMKPDVGDSIVGGVQGSKPLDIVIITAGVFKTEDFKSGPKWNDELQMYTTSSIAPVFIVHRLAQSGLLQKGSKVILVSSEAGSIALRTEAEGNYAHHASKAALNMVGKLLSQDLKEKGVVVSIVHPGFMRTEMTRDVGFEQFWDKFHAVTPEEAAKSLIDWAEKLDMSKSGQFWAPRGPEDIGTVEEVLGKSLPTPLELPW
ncbi:oxidoreductase [Podospora appendiculata]|uniref:Oxidoreductase n=1 Tax=Podospora appendiculata TaxID=314037 RepID=A0AAE0XHW6_9PEZI|nr:oxidoreductase [Podospora appendiculata]